MSGLSAAFPSGIPIHRYLGHALRWNGDVGKAGIGRRICHLFFIVRSVINPVIHPWVGNKCVCGTANLSACSRSSTTADASWVCPAIWNVYRMSNIRYEKFYVVDDEQPLRQMMATALDSQGLEVETFPSGVAFLKALKQLQPGYVFLDIRMPAMDGLEVLKRLRQTWPSVPVVMISGHGDIATAVGAMRAGAVDFIEKPFRLATLFEVVRKLQNNELAVGTQAQPLLDAASLETVLSHREIEVLNLLVQGHQNKAVGIELGISPRTVEVHRARIMQRLGVNSFAEMIRAAVTAGLGGSKE